MQEDHLHSEATLAITDPGAPAGLTAVQLSKRSLDTFLAKDIKGWAELCDEDIVVEFPFAPDVAFYCLTLPSAKKNLQPSISTRKSIAMSENSKIGLEGLLRPEDSILVLIDYQPCQFK